MSGPGVCWRTSPGPCHQQAVGGPSHDDQAFSVQFEALPRRKRRTRTRRAGRGLNADHAAGVAVHNLRV